MLLGGVVEVEGVVDGAAQDVGDGEGRRVFGAEGHGPAAQISTWWTPYEGCWSRGCGAPFAEAGRRVGGRGRVPGPPFVAPSANRAVVRAEAVDRFVPARLVPRTGV